MGAPGAFSGMGGVGFTTSGFFERTGGTLGAFGFDFRDRTFFSDNWSSRVRNWLPTVDHPYDKSANEFVITAPAHYQVVSNGVRTEETDLGGGLRRTHWKNSVPIATWLYFLGVAEFAQGRPTGETAALTGPEVRVDIALGMGDAAAWAWGCDLSYDYVTINAVGKTEPLESHSPGLKRRLLVG